MLELLTSGGWVMVPLLIFAVLATAICLERTWTLRRSEVLAARHRPGDRQLVARQGLGSFRNAAPEAEFAAG